MSLEQGLEEIGHKILVLTRNELYMKMRFMDVALSAFYYVQDFSVDLLATDGETMYFNGQMLGGEYRQNRIEVNRAYLHLVLHCIFRHVFRRNGREELVWNLAADIAVESVIDDWNLQNIRKSQSWIRQRTYRDLKEEIKVFTAEKIYGVLVRWKLSDREMERMAREFTVDDHKYWAKDEDDEKQSEMNQRWQDISEKMQTDMETFSKEAASNTGHFLDQVRVENRQRYDYRSFLHKFAVLKEEVTVDDDSFDYVFYSYGLRLYGNMPLIEPQEWKEVKKVEDFAIVIDTSMSCSGDLVKKFLEETYGILSETGSFFQRVNIHIIQCDDQVQSDRKITCKEELQEYMEKLDLAGEGGTDFRPAFAYIDELIATHRFTELKGVIYFTDGQGIYPQKMPLYQTAFVFMDTSMSCSGDLVKKFLEETYGILSETGSFFQRVNIHIIQCDDQVQSDRKITCKEELQEYMEKLDLAGEGGTDFRPAFAYIDELIATHRFTELKGVIYFTDGQGIYPQKMPLYQTAFVFMDDGAEEQEVPPWAMKLVLDEEDLRGVRNR